MDHIVQHDIIKRIALWYRWQLTFSEKRVFLRRFPEVVRIGFAKQKISDIKPFLDSLLTTSEDNPLFTTRTTALNRLFRVFHYVDLNRKMRNKPIDYYANDHIRERADTFISEFDTMMRDIVLSEQSVKTRRGVRKQFLEDVDADESFEEADLD